MTGLGVLRDSTGAFSSALNFGSSVGRIFQRGENGLLVINAEGYFKLGGESVVVPKYCPTLRTKVFVVRCNGTRLFSLRSTFTTPLGRSSRRANVEMEGRASTSHGCLVGFVR